MMDEQAFGQLAQAYAAGTGLALSACDAEGELLFGEPLCPGCTAACPAARKFAVHEALRWGDPAVGFCPGDNLLWALPVMRNQELIGGLVTSVSQQQAYPLGASRPVLDIQHACQQLRELAESANLTNAALLAQHRGDAKREQERHYAIRSFKSRDHNSIRELYLREEPALFSAIRAGDRRGAREILNRILVVIHHHSGQQLDLIKSIFLELVVSMTRTAVEAGGDTQELLGANFHHASALARADNDEDVAHWLRTALEHLMDVISRVRSREPSALLVQALTFMQQHCATPLSRDDVANAVGYSGSHFSALIRREAGISFSELLARIRIDRAAELLARTDLPIGNIADRCGFRDASYFTKVFRRQRDMTPGAYRKRQSQQ